MAEEVEKNDGWGIFDRLKNLPRVTAVKGDLKRTPCKTSLQSEIDDEEPDVLEIPAPQQQLTNNPTVKQNESGEGGEELEIEKDDDGALSNRDLLNQLHAVAVGIRDFEVLGANPKLTELVGEVKDKRVRPKRSNSDNSTKSKAKESSETKLSIPKKSSSSKATSKAILKAASEVRNGVIVKESKEREKLAFSDNYLEKAFGLSNITRLSDKANVSISAKKSTIASDDGSAKRPLKAKTLTTKQPAKKEARQRESGWDSEDKLPTKKKAKVSAKSVVKQRLRVLLHERRVLPEAALAEVLAAKEEQELAETEMAKLVDEFRDTKNDNFNDLPPDVTERWIAAHAKKLHNSFNFHSTIIRHTLASVTPNFGP